jgi:hypothetical protein
LVALNEGTSGPILSAFKLAAPASKLCDFMPLPLNLIKVKCIEIILLCAGAS